MRTKMKSLLLIIFAVMSTFIFSACVEGTSAVEGKTRTIIDMAGRKVKVPVEISEVYSTGQPGVVALYTLCPEKLMGWCIQPADAEAEFINAKYLNLPVLGLSQGANSNASKEEIIAREPDIIIYMTDLSGGNAEATAEEMEEAFKIPVVVVNYELITLDESYEFLGELLKEEERAKELSDYCKKIIDETKKITKTIKEEDKVSVYYAQGSTGLQSAPKGSSHSQVIDLVGGINVCELDAIESGRVTTDIEQVFKWDPDVVICSYSVGHSGTNIGNTDVFEIISNANPMWKLLRAVNEENIFSTPCLPYNWLDMPPSANRIIGVMWLAELLYPNYYNFDIIQETKDFYRLFYRIELTDEQIDKLLVNAIRE